VTNLIIEALRPAMLDPLWTPTDAHMTKETKKGIRDQNKIRWQHIVRRRFARSLTQFGQTNKDHILRRNLHLIWDTILTLWRQRNEIVHQQVYEDRTERNKQKLEAKIELCYAHLDRMSATNQDHIFIKDKAEILQEDKKYIKTWIRMAEQKIRVSKREEKRHINEKK
jgi:hypothetical protein